VGCNMVTVTFVYGKGHLGNSGVIPIPYWEGMLMKHLRDEANKVRSNKLGARYTVFCVKQATELIPYPSAYPVMDNMDIVAYTNASVYALYSETERCIAELHDSIRHDQGRTKYSTFDDIKSIKIIQVPDSKGVDLVPGLVVSHEASKATVMHLPSGMTVEV
jgi:hypothetical protein